jgi:hypothetical protein
MPDHSSQRDSVAGALCGVVSTVVLPVGTVAFGKWWVFWGVGTRLLVAGIVQVSGGGPTSAILGSTAPSVQEKQLARELGWANLCLGLAGLLALVPGWALPAGLAGGIYLLIAGVLHVPKRGKNAQESLATWTDLIVGVAVVVLAVDVLVRALAR